MTDHYLSIYTKYFQELAWRSGSVMDCHATARGSIPGGYGVLTQLHVPVKGVPSLNDLAVDGTLNTTNQLTKIFSLWAILTFVMRVSGHKSTTDWCEDPTRHLDDAKNRRISTHCIIV